MKMPVPLRHNFVLPLLAGGLLLTALPSLAQQPPQPVEAAARQLLETETQGLPGRVEIHISPMDPRNQLPPCAAFKAFLPGGTRAWGQISVGVQCESPVTWQVYLQARIAVQASYLVTARPLRAGQIVGPADLSTRSGDLAALQDNTLTDATQAIGHRTRYALAQGQPVRGDMLRIPAAVQQGQNVKVVSRGEGFQVSSEGRAMNTAAPGEKVRVRMPNNQVVTGTASVDGSVEISY
ncbi:flagellar basal body P-ring formation protein FlgA [Azoarcus sp. L1K30]|uniref:flagellar basal body P-ring formation chaperone FlgA n=1 Tax=Azoarcus sp. L1K30 TaxID=2820277 RepID=UPI001B845F8C|nr:flagellar basal body P-ring formation chaperone FlgA [Azoarcus sp. L1K30]MBR0565949.1 flagellar basal body P-ring formation protein FlgA [Azoarcus sp. L1K30]